MTRHADVERRALAGVLAAALSPTLQPVSCVASSRHRATRRLVWQARRCGWKKLTYCRLRFGFGERIARREHPVLLLERIASAEQSADVARVEDRVLSERQAAHAEEDDSCEMHVDDGASTGLVLRTDGFRQIW